MPNILGKKSLFEFSSYSETKQIDTISHTIHSMCCYHSILTCMYIQHTVETIATAARKAVPVLSQSTIICSKFITSVYFQRFVKLARNVQHQTFLPFTKFTQRFVLAVLIDITLEHIIHSPLHKNYKFAQFPPALPVIVSPLGGEWWLMCL